MATDTPRKTQVSRPAKHPATTAPGTTKAESLQEQVHVYRKAEIEHPNPLRQGLRLEKVPPPCVITIFGATGDLTHRKILPAIYNLRRAGLLPAETSVNRNPPSLR